MADYKPDGNDADIDRILSSLEEALDDDELYEVLEPSLLDGAGQGNKSVDGDQLNSDDLAVIATNRANTTRRVRSTVINRMRAALKKALGSAGEGLGARVILDTLRRQMQILKASADGIGAQEVSASYNEAREEALERTGPTHKAWITRGDAAVRPTHAAIHGQEVPWGSGVFDNGLTRPMDPRGPLSEVMGCRCKLMPVYRED